VGGVAALRIEAPTVARLRGAGGDVGATLFQVLATAWAALLGRYSGQDDVVFSTATDLRQRPEFESVVGFSLTPLVLRVDLAGARSFPDLVLRVRNDLLDGLDNLVPFERIVRELTAEADGANPIYQTMVILEPPAVAPDPAWSVHQMESEIGGAVGNCKLDLELGLDERPEGHIEGRLIYDTDLFDPPSASRMVHHFQRILDSVAQNPAIEVDALLALSATEELELAQWNATTTVRRPVLVHELVEAQAKRTPLAPALRGPDGTLTYSQLVARAGDTARRLATAGVGEGDVVAFCAEPAAELVADILGTLTIGAAYLLVDPTLPAPVLQAIVDEAGAAVVYADPSLGSTLSGAPAPIRGPDGGENGARRSDEEGHDGLFCLHYRLMDGEQKGVELAERAVVNLLRSVAAEVGLGSADTVLVLRPTLFEAGALELWLGLSVGATVVLAPPELTEDGQAVHRLLSAERISFLHASPSTWQRLIETGLRPTRGLTALCGGGPLDAALAGQLLERCRVVFSAFGTPETTFYVTLGRLEPGHPVAIGRPIANTRAVVVDASGLPVPTGTVGRLVVAGLGVAGARELQGASEDAFVDDPFGPGVARITGERARWRSEGVLELVTSRTPTRVGARH
jgi:non-ribosomal peptide synthetase component F